MKVQEHLMRMRLLHYGLENIGSVYEDENGDEYLTVLPIL
jgi:hypothetical protein